MQSATIKAKEVKMKTIVQIKIMKTIVVVNNLQ
jgi:hypothetical protein